MGGGGFLGSILTTLDSTLGGSFDVILVNLHQVIYSGKQLGIN